MIKLIARKTLAARSVCQQVFYYTGSSHYCSLKIGQVMHETGAMQNPLTFSKNKAYNR
jgi:hypothetical protein